MSDSEPPVTHQGALRDAYEAGQRRIDYQTQLMENLDNKALLTFRFALLSAGVLITGVSAGQVHAFINPDTTPWFFLGALGLAMAIVFFGITIVCSLAASRVSVLDSGATSGEIDDVLETRPNEGEWLEAVLERQASQIKKNSTRLKEDYNMMRWSQIAFLLAWLGLFTVFLSWF